MFCFITGGFNGSGGRVDVLVDLLIVLSHFSGDSLAELDIDELVAATDVLNPVHVSGHKSL